MKMGKVVLVVAAHPDDEVLGVAGTIMKHVKAGHEVHVLFMADGVTARDREYNYEESKDRIDERKGFALNACELMGVSDVSFCDYPNLRMDTIPQLHVAKKIEDKVFDLRPDIVYTHHAGDMNQDHRITFEAVMTACRPLPDFCVREIYTFEVLSSTEWAPTMFWPSFTPDKWIDISEHIEDKLKAVECYDLEMRPFPHPRSEQAIRSLAQLRGSQVGIKNAECFCTVRHIT